jgi:quercetin dioxygenase-like cupin family protein
MSLPHASSGDVIAIPPLGEKLPHTVSTAFVKSSQLEVMRLVLHAGKSISEHCVNGEMTLQCIEGEIELSAHGGVQLLRPHELVFLAANVRYAMRAKADSSLLMTVVIINE